MLNQSAVDALYSATYIEDYLDSVESLPDDLQRHVTRLKEIDLVIQSYFREVSGSMKRLLELIRNSEENSCEISRLQARIQSLLISCQELGDEKIHVGQEIHEAIENKNRQLELDRKNLDSVYREGNSSSDPKDNPPGQQMHKEDRKRARRIRHETFIPSTLGPATLAPTLYNADGKCALPIVIEPPPLPLKSSTSSTSIHKNYPTDDEDPVQSQPASTVTTVAQPGTSSSKEKKETSAPASAPTTPVKSEKRKIEAQQQQQQQAMKRSRRRRRSSTKATEKQIPIPMDPDEPTYCLCDQVSYGEMIGCDNDLCPIEWFHFSCVSLSTKPKGKWFCPKCRGDRPNQMKPKNIFLKELETYNKEKEEKT